MPDRHIPPLALFIRERQPHKLRKHRRLRCRLRVERDNLRRLKRTEHRVQRSLRIYHDVFGGRSLVRRHIQHPQLLAPCATHAIRRYAVHHAEKLKLAHQRQHLAALKSAEPRRIGVQLHRHIAPDGSQHLAMQRQLFVLAHRLLYTRRLHLVYMLVNALDAAILGEQFDRRLPAHSRHARDVVRLVPL